MPGADGYGRMTRFHTSRLAGWAPAARPRAAPRLCSIAAALQAPPQQGAAGKEQFVAWWRDSVHGLALMVHHKSNDPADRGRMAAVSGAPAAC